MKFPVVAVVVLLASSLMAQSSAPSATGNGPVFSFHFKGTFAQFSSFQSGSFASLNAGRSSEAGQQITTSLNFNTFSSNSDGFTETFAFGLIPNDALRGGSDKHVSLSVDTSQLASFETSTCTFSFSTFLFECQPGPFGLVQIDWDQNGNFTRSTISDVKETFLQGRFHTHENSDS